jgi:hypothetical protein
MNPPVTASDPPPSPLKGMAVSVGLAFLGTAIAIGVFLVALQTMNEHHVARGWKFAASLVYGAVVLVIAFSASRLGQRVSHVTPTAAARRYRRRFFAAISAYVVSILISTNLFANSHPAPWLAWILALAPALCIVATIVVMGLYLREETDELERAIVSESALWATGGLLAIATTWGFLEQFGLVIHVVVWAAFPLWAFGMGVANAFVRRRYR